MTATLAALSDSTHCWRITGTVGATSVDIYLDQPDGYEWQRPEPSRKAVDPCGGAPTLLYRSDGTLPKRAGRPTFQLRQNRAAALADLRTIYRLRGPWTVTTPTESFSAVVDPTQGTIAEQNRGTYWAVSFGLAEV